MCMHTFVLYMLPYGLFHSKISHTTFFHPSREMSTYFVQNVTFPVIKNNQTTRGHTFFIAEFRNHDIFFFALSS